MDKKYAVFLFFLLLTNLPFLSHAQFTAPKYSNEFLNIGVGARALGMSGAQTAIANDVTAGYWNPAGLLHMESKYEVSLMHAEYFAGIAKYDYAAFATRIDSNSVLAITGIRFGVDDIPDTRFLYDNNGAINYNNIRFFSAADYGFLLSYARQTPSIPGLRMGANVKVIHRVVGQFANAWGFGLDAGIQYDHKKWRFGAVARDVTSTFNAWNHNTALVKDIYLQTGNDIPVNSIEVTLPRLIIGVGREFSLFEDRIGILASVDLVSTFDGMRNTLLKTNLVSVDPYAGLEIDYKKIVYIRGGVGNIQEVKDWDDKTYTSIQPNFGIGVKIYKFSIDYALTNIGDMSEVLYSNVFSLKLAI
ncbi:PorV/PorQ family protein [Cytophagaceae bacterium ABcell3]|nr:PorV/PorQ family protein [Cytophagaceae bacterium ABcell3]